MLRLSFFRLAPLLLALGLAGSLLSPAEANHLGQVGSRGCSTQFTPPNGFDRWHGSGASAWNPCQTDLYGPPEWIYWNILPGYPGYNNPSANPYYTAIATGVTNWASALSYWKFTYKSGDWSAGTDAFFAAPFNLDPIGSYWGLTYVYKCSSPTSCGSYLAYDDVDGFHGRYNLIYIYLDDDPGFPTRVVAHELGHGFGLNHSEFCPTGNDTIMESYVGCGSVPTADDAAAVNAIYPDP